MTEAERAHVWEIQELTLYAEYEYSNPYMDVDVWIDLRGPDFNKRVYGFWNGGQEFIIRFTCTKVGFWSWVSGSNQEDTGFMGYRGTLEVEAWTESEKMENPCRRGIIKVTENGRAFCYADGTPFYFLGDTWWAAATERYTWYEDEHERPVGSTMGFKDYVRYRKGQGFNGVGLIASFPTWDDDGYPSTLIMNDDRNTTIRAAWQVDGRSSVDGFAPRPAKNMKNEGGRPFLFPGKVPGYEAIVPDFQRINPEYFKFLDKKIRYLHDAGMSSCIEAVRRDVSQVWKRYYPWPESYTRYIHYVYSRYQAFNTFLSPIHFDFHRNTIPAKEFNEPVNLRAKRYGELPYGNPVSTNAGPSTLLNFGGHEEAPWLTYHQIGNWREHVHYWHLTEIFQSEPAKPGINGEPYYPGFPDNKPSALSEEANRNCRSGMYGSFLSGALGGYIYGAQGMWGGDRSEEADYRMWEALQFPSGDQVRHLGSFINAQGSRYAELIPDQELLVPNKTGDPYGYRGWAFCARTRKKDWILCYFEPGCPKTLIRSLLPTREYSYAWFNPRTGMWLPTATDMIQEGEDLLLRTDAIGQVALPDFPDGDDWALSIRLIDKTVR